MNVDTLIVIASVHNIDLRIVTAASQNVDLLFVTVLPPNIDQLLVQTVGHYNADAMYPHFVLNDAMYPYFVLNEVCLIIYYRTYIYQPITKG